MFFFSSRRRHTRCLSDWSSDVCSSDLLRLTQVLVRLLQSGVEPHLTRGERQVLAQLTEKLAVGARKACRLAPGCDHDARSEERRVGKEGRARRGRASEEDTANSAQDSC